MQIVIICIGLTELEAGKKGRGLQQAGNSKSLILHGAAFQDLNPPPPLCYEQTQAN
jgi:hypothetical protein